MVVWRVPLKLVVVCCLLSPVALAQVPDVEVDVSGPLNDTGALPDCDPFPGLVDGAADLSTGPFGQVFAPACRATTPRGVNHLVTGHSVFVAHVGEPTPEARFLLRPQPYGPPDPNPTDFDPSVPPMVPIQHGPPPVDDVRMYECVAWFNGFNLDVRPAFDLDTGFGRHFSDADQGRAKHPNHDVSGQDHDLDTVHPYCAPDGDNVTTQEDAVGVPTDFAVLAGIAQTADGARWGDYAVVVERGDCAPSKGMDFRFRAHLDFVDPNDVYHEVQEYDYLCPSGGPANAVPTDVQEILGPFVPGPEHDADPLDDTERCDPARMLDPDDTSADQRRCRGTVEDATRERLWITRTHDRTYDFTTMRIYSFALVVDTCAGINVYDGTASSVAGQEVTPLDRSLDPGGYTRDRHPHPIFPLVNDVNDGLADDAPEQGTGVPGSLDDACIDGSSLSFDDTERGRYVHSGPPRGLGADEIMDGDSYDFDQSSPTIGTHRTNCRHNWMEWPYNDWAPGVGEDCYPEDHRTAEPDVYVYEEDPTGGLFVLNSNGQTSAGHPYSGPGVRTGPNCGTPDEPPCPWWA